MAGADMAPPFSFDMFPRSAWTEIVSEGPEKPLGPMTFIPGDDEIPGWKRSEKVLRASNEEELYKFFNGGARLYIQYGFRSYAGQSFKGPRGTELKYTFLIKERLKTQRFEDRFTKPSQNRKITNLGEKARIDMTPYDIEPENRLPDKGKSPFDNLSPLLKFI